MAMTKPTSEQVTFLASGTGASQRTVLDKLRDVVSVKDFGAVGDGVTDDYAALQAACDYVYSIGGGTVYIPTGTYICNTPLRVQRFTNLIGAGRASTIIRKDSTTTKAVTIYSVAGVVYPGVLPSNINAVVVLDGPSGKYIGKISGLTLEGTLSSVGNYETQKVQFGIVSVGTVNDSVVDDIWISTTQYGWYFPVIFASTITNTRVSTCLIGSGIENGTSLTYTSNYMNSCRDVGHYLRAVKYSLISANACDALNRADFYPTRTRTCVAYWLRSLIGCNVVANGDETTLGRSYFFNNLDNCVVEGNTTIGLGSDYVGADQIAWQYTDGVLRCCRIENNIAYSVNANGLLYGGAVAAQHHNIYFETTANFLNTQFQDNIARTAVSSIVEAGWLNNVKPSDYIEENTFVPIINGTTTAGVGTYTAQVGTYTRVGNRVFFSIRLSWSAHTGTGDMVIAGLPYASRNTPRNESAVTIGWIQTLALSAANIPSAYIAENSSEITLQQFSTGGGSVSAVPIDSVAGLIVSGSYYAAT